jgi:hypothetical protein
VRITASLRLCCVDLVCPGRRSRTRQNDEKAGSFDCRFATTYGMTRIRQLTCSFTLSSTARNDLVPLCTLLPLLDRHICYDHAIRFKSCLYCFSGSSYRLPPPLLLFATHYAYSLLTPHIVHDHYLLYSYV